MYKFAKSTGGFYATDVFGSNVPPDAVDVSDDEHRALMIAQSSGATIQADAAGNPIAVPKPAPTLADIKAAKLVELVAACSRQMDAIKAGYPADEVQSWDKQETEARAYTANNTAATPLLSALATARGIALADLAARVIKNADAFASTAGAIIGKRQKYEDQVNAATDAATVAAIVWQ